MLIHAHDDSGLQLAVLLPLAPRRSTSPPSFHSGAQSVSWQRSDAHGGDSRLSSWEDSACTDAEKLAVEQLVELKKIRLLEDSQSPELESLMASCDTERSFNIIQSSEPFSPMGSSSEFADRWRSREIPDVETSSESRYEDTLDLDFDERARPRSRLLTDLYRRGEEEYFRFLDRPKRKGEGKRRKLHKILKSTASGGNFE